MQNRPMNPSSAFLQRLAVRLPIIQAPMAGVSTPAMAAAVSMAGGLGSLGVGAVDADGARRMIDDVRRIHRGALNVNVFCHAAARADAEVESRWIGRFRPVFAEFGAAPPTRLREIYRSFVDDPAMLSTLLDARPSVVSFHFGLPPDAAVRALREAGIVTIATATNLDEARAIADAGIDAIVAQGWEAGGHRGVFDPEARDDRLGTVALTRLLVRHFDLPVIAAGGIMDGAGIVAMLRLGAAAVQLGTAFVGCDESAADGGYRAALGGDAALHTAMTSVISGRPARCLRNRFTQAGAAVDPRDLPAYPLAYDLGKALHAAAKSTGEYGFGAQWAGQGAPLSRPMPAARLMAVLEAEMAAVT